MSAEARSAAVWREGGQHPEPPASLSKEAKRLWNEIVRARPIDYFQPGSRTLLAQFCEMAVEQDENLRVMRENRGDPDAQRVVRDMAQTLNMTATKLRLTIQTEVDRKSGKLDEKEPTARGKKGKADVLFGGNVVKF
jgi:hypothetical protein